MNGRVVMCLGRYGDIMSILPLMLHLSQHGPKPSLCVAEEFQTVMEGVSYCDTIVYPGLYNEPAKAHRWLQAKYPGIPITIAQHYRHPFDRQRLTSSYQTESWRNANELGEFGKHPLVFDRRDMDREDILSDMKSTAGRDHILVCLESVSSPFKQKAELMRMIVMAAHENAVIYDMTGLRASRVYDLIGLYEKSLCLISVDTMHLHLARAAKVPVIAIINDGFFGSIPPPGAIANIRYSDPQVGEKVRVALAELVDAKHGLQHVIHACDIHGEEPRHIVAKASWGKFHAGRVYQRSWAKDSSACGDARCLPSLKAILTAAADICLTPRDVVIFNNSDIAIAEGSVPMMAEHAAMFGAFSMRRVEEGMNYTHIGRDLFGFTAEWIRVNIDAIPDFYIGAPYFDLVLAALIRKQRGIVTTKRNLLHDFYPCEMEPGAAIHERHAPAWDVDNHLQKLPANNWNRNEALRWCKDNCPSLEL